MCYSSIGFLPKRDQKLLSEFSLSLKSLFLVNFTHIESLMIKRYKIREPLWACSSLTRCLARVFKTLGPMPVLQNDKVKKQMFQVRVETFLLHSSTPTALCGYFSKDKKGTKQVLILEATDS